MARYMQKYVGTYRVLAEYDRSTNDFPRLENGNIDPSFDDLYIACASKSRIYHVGGRVLEAYIPSIGRGRNILKALYESSIGSLDDCSTVQLDAEGNPNGRVSYDYDKIYSKLIESNVLIDIKETSEEVLFRFFAVHIEKIADVMHPKTSGAGISPFSTKNLPKSDYKIPEEDLLRYKQATANIPSDNLSVYLEINNSFFDKIATAKRTVKDMKSDMRLKCMKVKEYIHSTGRWNEYLKYIEKFVKEKL